MSLVELLNKAGIGGYLLVSLSIISTYMFIKNFFLLFIQERDIPRRGVMLDSDRDYDSSRMGKILRNIGNLGNLSPHELKSEILYLFHANFKDVENTVMWLRLGASLSTLLGLFGTVLGMVQLFKGISFAKQVDPSVLAGGIWEALLATGMGLFAAILHLIYQHILASRLRWMGMFLLDYGCSVNYKHATKVDEHSVERAESTNKLHMKIIRKGEVLS